MVLAGQYGSIVVASTANGHTTLTLPERFNEATLAVSLDGQRLAIGSGSSVTLWQLTTGRLYRRVMLPKPNGGKALSPYDRDTIASVAISPNGKRIAADSRRSVAVWNTENGSLIRQFVRSPKNESDVENGLLNGSTGDIPPVCFTPDGSGVVSGQGAIVKCWELSTGKPRWVRDIAEGFDSGVSTAFAFSKDGGLLAIGDGNGHVVIMDQQRGEIARRLTVSTAGPGMGNAVKRVAFTPDGSLLLTAPEGHAAILCRTADGKQTAAFGQQEISAQCQALSPDGKLLVVGTWDGLIILINAEDGTVVRTLPAHNDHVCGIAFSPDGHLLSSAGEDNRLILWDTQTWKMVSSYSLRAEGFISTLRFSKDGNTLYSTGMGVPILAWRVRDLSPEHTYISAHGSCWQAAALSPDDTKLVAGWNTINANDQIDNTYLVLLNTQTGAIIWKNPKAAINYSPLDFYESPMVFSPDGQLLAWGHEGGLMEVLRAVDGKRMYITKSSRHSNFPIFGPHAPAFTPDGRQLLACDTDHSLSVYRTGDGTILETEDVFSADVSILMGTDGTCYTIGLDGIAKWKIKGIAP